MPRIARDTLLTLEAYARERKDFRARVLAHKKPRSVHLGEHVVLLFEDELTIRYQVQEMLRIEKIFEEAGGAFPALRADAADDRSVESGRRVGRRRRSCRLHRDA